MAVRSRIPVGVADSVFADREFNPEKTIRWAAHHRFDPVQIYLNTDRLASAEFITRINSLARKLDIGLLAHAPGNALFSSDCRREIFDAAGELLRGSAAWWGTPLLVWHVDPVRSIREHLDVHDAITAAGLRSAPENYIKNTSVKGILSCLSVLEDLWRSPSVIPVLDLPRYFSVDDPINSKAALRSLELASVNPRAIFHVIDGIRPLLNRRNWCPPGKGQCSWDHLWPHIQQGFPDFALILEYEDRSNPIEARQWMKTNRIR